MVRTITFRLAIALPLAMPFAFVNAAHAERAVRLSYEQAWAQCKLEIANNVPLSDNAISAGRYAAGGACLKRYGYRLKKAFYAARAAAVYDSYGSAAGYGGNTGTISRYIGYHGNAWRDDQITGGGW